MSSVLENKKKKKKDGLSCESLFWLQGCCLSYAKKDGLQFNVLTEVFMIDHQFYLVLLSLKLVMIVPYQKKRYTV